MFDAAGLTGELLQQRLSNSIHPANQLSAYKQTFSDVKVMLMDLESQLKNGQQT